ncbi:ATP-binding response regulator [Denitrobaculum tricleocarpae]|uniref:histidine kinase n=1 Tax=Denitrobaculum tricleocarpae TaxID=2591009 RepID=A0A545TKY6_9PROT|nr:hybrid sensor histidine kinase/response regulator [Denitrobaculum tricleocarpae]TQV77856.1 response regulator [Denitrobaculum tricleocarpae]
MTYSKSRAIPDELTSKARSPCSCEPHAEPVRPDKTPRETYRVLHVDDDSVDHVLIRKLLSKIAKPKFDVVSLTRFKEAQARLSNETFHVGLIDYRLGERSGLELVEKLGGRSGMTPLIILTGRGDYAVDVEATEAGAYDYLDKEGLCEILLERTIRHVRVQFETEQQLRESEALLRRATHEAETANSAKSDFLARMSHDFRTPLNAIIGFSEAIQQEIAGPIGASKYLDYASDINQSGQVLLSMISDILDLSKIESGNIELNETDILIEDAVSMVLKMVLPGAKAAKISIETDLPENLPILRADRQLLERMLINSLTNAIKFTSEAGRILLGAEVTKDGLQLTVEDNGIGIPPQQIPRVIEPFAQIRRSENASAGAGLGLSIINSFIKLHGGALAIESEVGAGTRIILKFPSHRLRQRPSIS